ncbi:MAG: PAS domain S-box protein [Nitrospinae bacterium]|nr:PAS domain S-box protein [Nitrospinota bacterium]
MKQEETNRIFTIRNKLIIIFLLISILPFIILGYTIYKEGESILRGKIFNQLSNIADGKEKKIRNWFIERFNDTEMIAHNRFMEINLSKLLLIKKDYEHRGFPPAKYTGSEEYSTITSFLNMTISQFGVFSEIFILDTTGHVVLSTNADRLDIDESNNDYFKIPISQGEVYIKDVYYSDRFKQPIITFSDVIYDYRGAEHGVVAGVVVAKIKVNEILEPLVEETSGMGETGEEILVNKDNITLLNLKFLKESALKYKLPEETPSTLAIAGKNGITEGIDYRKRHVLAAYRHIPDLNWGLVVKMDIDEAYAPIYRLLSIIIIFTIAGIGIILFLVSQVSRRVAAPLIEMKSIAREISHGNYQKGNDYELKRTDEIGDLARSIREMSISLNKKQLEVENYKQELESKLIEISEKNLNLEKTYQELYKTKNHLEKIVEHSKDIIITTDINGNIVEFNPEAEERLGYKKDAIINKPATLLYQNSDERKAIMELVNKFGVVRNREICLLSRNGDVHHVSLTISQLKNDAGEIVGTVGISKDISEERMLQFKLIQSEKMAGIGTLASGIAHEINNPLAGILGMAEAILDENDIIKVNSYAKDIVRYTIETTAIVKELLTYSRQTQNESISTIDMAVILENSIKMAKHTIDFSSITIISDLKKGCWTSANAGEMQQVFINLIINSIHAMEEKGGKLILSCYKNGDSIKAVVTDTGIGIKKNNLTQIYTPFFTTKPVGKGTGLGLYVVYKIVTKYNGHIDVISDEGKGTSFVLTFPIVESISIQENYSESKEIITSDYIVNDTDTSQINLFI